jgi:hypothetical protein
MIKSKIDARERALEMVASLGLHDRESIMDMAQEFTDFLIGDAVLPEVFDDNDNIKTLIGMIETEMAAFRKQGNDNLDALTNFLEKRGMALSGTPCKSTTE